MKRLSLCFLLAALALAPTAWPQENANRPPNRAEAAKIFAEMVDVMEATAIVVPELARAGAPLTENVRQSMITLQTGSNPEHTGVIYRLLTNARVYIQLVDAMPKPAGFSDDVRRQLDTLRRDIDHGELYFRSLLDRREEQIRGADRDNLKRYSEDNSTIGVPAPSEDRVVFLGDSITDGWKLNQYFPGKPFVNRGISGQITGQMLGRMQADVIDRWPKAMVFLGGTNDLARGVTLDAIKNNISMIIDLAVANDIKPVMASILPVSDYHADKDPRNRRTPDRRPEDINELNRWLKAACEQRGVIYLDYFTALADENAMLGAALADDGLHPNAEGYKIMAPLAQQSIDQALKGSKKPEPKKKRFGVF